VIVSKSLLAKLLASENITVEHRKTVTAYFDTKNRVMVLPMWKEMTSELYDLLLGHETGHALFTPNEGWHNNLKDKTKPGFKTYLNVVEDVRIEKMIQEKFPGLKTSFKKGYSDLMEKDFFGVYTEDLDISDLALIDRINLHYKVGSYLNIQFSKEEQYFINLLDNMETWEDVEDVANKLYANGKKELREQLKKMFPELGDGEEGDDDIEYDFEETEDGVDDNRKRHRGWGGSDSDFDDDQDPESVTDRYFRQRESSLIDDSMKPFHYANCPTANLRHIIVPYKNIKQFYNNFSCSYESEEEAIKLIEEGKNKAFTRFNETNKKYISYLIKEFEMRRNARQYARASVSKTGELDLKKVHQYKTNDDLFKRIAVVPKGKSHGLVIFIDYSGSMYDNIKATIEQTLILATFCRKVSIPFRVYAFTDSNDTPAQIARELGYDITTFEVDRIQNPRKYSKFSSNMGELDLNDSNGFRLREYLSSEMSSIEFKEASKYWLLVGELYNRRGGSWRNQTQQDTGISQSIKNSDFEDLGGTPLNETVIASMEIVKEFRKKYRLDIVNTVFLTDGDANENNRVIHEPGQRGYLPNTRYGDSNVIIRDMKTMNEGRARPKSDLTIALLELLKANTGVNVIGFYISSGNFKRQILSRLDRSGNNMPDFDEKFKKAKKQKFFMINGTGYDDYYIIPGGGELDAKDDEMQVEENATKSQLKSAFMMMQKSKGINRVLLSRFVEKIA
jgi:hypothetical protein